MGTWVAIEAIAATERAAELASEAAYGAVAEVERHLHPHHPGSDLERINSTVPQTRVCIGAIPWRVLQLAQVVHFLSDGAFDPCLPSRPGRLGDLALSPPGAEPAWALCRVPIALDLGGIAKGYAIDLAIEALRAAGCESGLVNAGGDLRVYGRRKGILLRHADGNCVPMILANEALAVSDVEARHHPPEHRGYYRRSGAPGPLRPFAAVVAERAGVADALTKCVLLADARCAARTLRAFNARRVG